MEDNFTNLTWLASRDIDKLCDAVKMLPCKIEIKGNPVFNNGKWYLFFITPEPWKIESRVI